jgi:hypothetical protein
MRPIRFLSLVPAALVLAACSGGSQHEMVGASGSDGGLRGREGGSSDGGMRRDGPADAATITIGIASSCHMSSQVNYSAAALRGYGTLSGELLNLDCAGGAVSVLAISAADSAHAALTHAKYLSDLGTLQAVTPVTLGSAAGFTVPGQGTIVAFASGSTVFVVTGVAATDVTAELAAIGGGGRTYAPSAAIPMYLNRWDKYGFNFYYNAWWSSDPTYDYTADFDYAQSHGGTGFAVWTNGALSVPEGEGELGSSRNMWAIKSALSRGLPAILNNSTEDTTPSWLLSQYRGSGSLLQRMPGFSGNECGAKQSFDSCYTPWGGGAVESAMNGVMQQNVRNYGTEPNVVSILEQHGEQTKGPFDLFVNYGPLADANLQAFLQTRYSSVQALDTAWYGGSGQLTSWSDVHAPGLSSFAGYDPSSFDIVGPWRVQAGTTAAAGSAPAWAATGFDDSAWGIVGNDDTRELIPTGAAAMRTQFTPTGATATGASWLYVWSLGTGCTAPVRAFINGTELTASSVVAPAAYQAAQWNAFQVSSLGSGAQTLALSIPACGGGYALGYQTYLSTAAPIEFPASATDAQRWADFADWEAQLRGSSLADGMSLIRQVDLDKPIELMAPNKFMDVDKANAQDYGGTFHDTGFMSGFWIDELPAQMRSIGFPFSAEPGGPASSAEEFRGYFGNWFTEGVNGVNYFQGINDVLTQADVKTAYEAWRPLIAALGKYHGAHTDVAQLFSRRTTRMLGFPWAGNANLDINGGATSAWSFGGLDDQYDFDAVTEGDFARGNAAQYKVIVDGNTSFMDTATVAAIQSWVSAGGTFITFLQTGRHSPAGANTWPISTLTGYSVKSIDPAALDSWSLSTTCSAGGQCPAGQTPGWALSEASGQTFLPTGWAGTVAAGLHMTKVAPEAQNVLMWPDQTVAVGVRPVGAGRVVTLGATFVTNEGWRGSPADEGKMITQLLSVANATPVPGKALASTLAGDAGAPVDFTGSNHFRHFVSNDGLYDVWILHLDGTATAQIFVNLTVAPAGATAATLPTSAFDVLSATELPMSVEGSSAVLKGVNLQPGDVRILLTPRNALTQAPRAWFELQRSWWSGTKAPSTTALPPPPHRYTIDLSTKYPMAENGTATGWSQSFSVPATWTGGQKELWVTDWANPVMFNQGSVAIDGTSVWGASADGAESVDISTLLTAGSHSFKVSVQPGGATVAGVRGEAWVRFIPAPAATLDLGGTGWIPSTDGFTFSGAITLPGAWEASGSGITSAKTSVAVPSSWSGSDVVLAVQSQVGIGDVIINGQWVHSAANWVSMSGTVRINLTSYVVPGATNTIQVFNWSVPQTSQCTSATCVQTIELESFPANGIYP